MRVFGATFLIAAFLLAGCLSAPGSPGNPTPGTPAGATHVVWSKPVGVGAADGGVGYEPGLVMDSAGALYYTAHKDLMRPETWPYPASWLLVSRDNGTKWVAPAGNDAAGALPLPAASWQANVGDEGDLAADARGWVYFVDTYAADNHLPAWSNKGQALEYSLPAQRTLGADDRPWIAAQGQGILHYLGNNGNQVNGGRVWYYRSTDGGYTWSTGAPVEGNGWVTLAAERAGKRVYMAAEQDANAAGEIRVYASEDQGATFGKAVVAGKRAGPGREYPVVTAGKDGLVFVLWMDAGDAANAADTGGAKPTRIFLARSTDAGKTFASWDVTPAGSLYVDYPTVDVNAETGDVGIAFYGADVPVKDATKWFVYGGVWRAAATGTPAFAFGKADETPVATTAGLHDLHDFFETVMGPDGHFNVAYQRNVKPGEADRRLFFVRGDATQS